MAKRFLKLNENLHLQADLGESDSKMTTFVVLGRISHSTEHEQLTSEKHSLMNLAT